MKLFKHLLLSSLVLVPAISFADASLNISLTVDEAVVEIENAVVAAEKVALFDNGFSKVEGVLLSQTDEATQVQLVVLEEDRVIADSTMDLEWGIPATVEFVYELEECSCLDRDVKLVVVAQPVE